MDLNLANFDLLKEFNYDFELILTDEAKELLSDKVKDYIHIVNLYTTKVRVSNDGIVVSYALPVLKDLDYLTKGIAEFFTDSYVKEIKIALKDCENNVKFTITGLVKQFCKPDWYLNLSNEPNCVELNVTYKTVAVRIS